MTYMLRMLATELKRVLKNPVLMACRHVVAIFQLSMLISGLEPLQHAQGSPRGYHVQGTNYLLLSDHVG